MKESSWRNNWRIPLISAISVLVLLLLWQGASALIDAQIILPGPGPVVKAFFALCSQPPFALNIGITVLRALESFLIIVAIGILLGILAGYYPSVEAALSPLLLVLKAVPVMSIILLAFIWFSSGTVPIFSAFLMAFPVMFTQMVYGVRSIDANLVSMADLYGFSQKNKLKHVIFPALTPHILTGSKQTLSMIWKVVIAAEVLTVPRYGVGSRMQLAQVHLDTAQVLAWTLIAVLLTALGDLCFLGLARWQETARMRRARRPIS